MNLTPVSEKSTGSRLVDVAEEYLRTHFSPARHSPRTKEIAHLYLMPFIRYAIAHPVAPQEDLRRYYNALTRLCQSWIDHLRDRGLAWETVSTYYRVVQNFTGWCRRQGYLLVDPMEAVFMPPRPVKTQALFTHEEYLLMREKSIGTILHPAIILGYRTGMSLVDCCLLLWSEVDMEALVIERTRHKMRHHGNQLIIPIVHNSDLHHLLLAQREAPTPNHIVGHEEYVCPALAWRYSSHGNSRTAKNQAISQCFRAFMVRIGLYKKGRTFSAFRHCFLSNLVNSGCNHALAGKMAGHSSLRMLPRYIKPDVHAMRLELIKAEKYAVNGKHDTLQIKPKTKK